jgi:hypothetical protein
VLLEKQNRELLARMNMWEVGVVCLFV